MSYRVKFVFAVLVLFVLVATPAMTCSLGSPSECKSISKTGKSEAQYKAEVSSCKQAVAAQKAAEKAASDAQKGNKFVVPSAPSKGLDAAHKGVTTLMTNGSKSK